MLVELQALGYVSISGNASLENFAHSFSALSGTLGFLGNFGYIFRFAHIKYFHRSTILFPQKVEMR